MKGTVALTIANVFSNVSQAEEGSFAEGLGSSGGRFVWGYTDKHSVIPGDKIDVMLSVSSKNAPVIGRLRFFRVGAAGEPELISESETFAVEFQPVPATASSAGANWDPTLFEVDTSNWPPGVVTTQFQSQDGKIENNVFLLVVRNPQTTDVLLKLGTNTYQAYKSGVAAASILQNGIQIPARLFPLIDRAIRASSNMMFFLCDFLRNWRKSGASQLAIQLTSMCIQTLSPRSIANY
jgi:hypothetical protein